MPDQGAGENGWLLALESDVVDREASAWFPAPVRKAASIRLGLLLVVSALLSCRSEKSDEKRCVDRDGQFVDEALCSTPAQPGEGAADGGVAGGATAGWDQPDGGAQPASGPQPARGGGFHFIWIPYGAFGGMGSYAPGYVRGGSGTGGAQSGAATGAAASGSVSRGGFGATGAAHAGSSTAGTAATAGS